MMIRVDSFLLADSAQVSNAKISMLGGGWNSLFVRDPEVGVPLIAIVGRVIVPLEEELEAFHLVIQLDDEQSVPPTPLLENPPRMTIAGETENEFQGGPEFAVPFAIDMFGLRFPHEGTYAFTISHDGEQLARTRFRVRFRT